MKLIAALLLLTGIASAQNCPSGWQDRTGTSYCYRFITTPKTWDNARDDCASQGGIITTVVDQAEQDYISGMIKSQSNDIWIGLLDKEAHGVWQWHDGLCITYINFSPGEPNYGNGDKDCAVMRDFQGFNNRWDDKPCDALNPYVCRKIKDGQVPTATVNTDCDNECKTQRPTTCVGYTFDNNICTYKVKNLEKTANGVTTYYIRCDTYCGAGWQLRPNTRSCYMFDQTSKKWSDANSTCANLGGGLTTIVDQAEQDYVSGLIKQQTNDVWIGLLDKEGQGIWRWEDGSCLSYIDFDPGEPNYGNGGKDCAVMRNYVTNYNRWDDKPCDSSFPFVCRKIPDEQGKTPIVNTDCENACKAEFSESCVGYSYKNNICTYEVKVLNNTLHNVNTTFILCDTPPPTEAPTTPTTTITTTSPTTPTTTVTTTSPTTPTTTVTTTSPTTPTATVTNTSPTTTTSTTTTTTTTTVKTTTTQTTTKTTPRRRHHHESNECDCSCDECDDDARFRFSDWNPFLWQLGKKGRKRPSHQHSRKMFQDSDYFAYFNKRNRW